MLSNVKKISWNKMLNIVVSYNLAIYIYFSHFKYPFSSTCFLYTSFFTALIILFFKKKLYISKSWLIFGVMVFITFMGILYTDRQELAVRQVIFFIIYFFLFLLGLQEKYFLKILRKIFFVFSSIISISLFVQFLYPTYFNILLSYVEREDIYRTVMRSFTVDHAFTGLASSVSMAAFSLFIIFIETLYNIIWSRVKKDREYYWKFKNKYRKYMLFLNVIIAIIVIFGIVLTKRRGIFIATIVVAIMIIIIDRNIIMSKINFKKIYTACFWIIVSIIVSNYFLKENYYAITFFERFKGNNISTGRYILYENALNEFLSSNILVYLFGKGTAASYMINDTGLHNVYLQILYDHGLVGIVIYLSFFINNIKEAIKERYFYSICMQILFLAYCITGNPLYDYYFFIPYLMFVCYEN